MIRLFDDAGKLVQLHPLIEAILSELLKMRGDIAAQQEGMAVLHFSASAKQVRASLWKKNFSAGEVQGKIDRQSHTSMVSKN